jgi:hypothetical protein
VKWDGEGRDPGFMGNGSPVDFFLYSSGPCGAYLSNISGGNPQIRMLRITTLRNYKHAA